MRFNGDETEQSDCDTEPNHEEQLLSKALQGDEYALEELLVQSRPQIYRVALRILQNPLDAEDAVQETMVSATRHLQDFEARSKFSTWLTRIAINTALMERRRRRGRLPTPPEDVRVGPRDREGHREYYVDSRPDPEKACLDREIAGILRSHVRQLSPTLRQAFQLRHLAGYSVEEAIEKLGISTSAFKSRVRRARRELARDMKPLAVALYGKKFSKAGRRQRTALIRRLLTTETGVDACSEKVPDVIGAAKEWELVPLSANSQEHVAPPEEASYELA